MWTTRLPSATAALGLLLLAAPHASGAGAGADFRTKRGLAYVQNDHEPDNRLMTSAESELSWYYTWSRNVARVVAENLTFVPMVHSLADASAPHLLSSLDRAPASSTHLLTFNEPDGEQHTGGSDASPRDAARAYIDRIVPLRNNETRRWRVSHPSVTGSPRGLEWLRDFNESCYGLDRDNGCPADFVAVHWYGDQWGLKGWLSQLHDFYTNNSGSAPGGRSGVEPKDLKFWVTELGLPQGDAKTTLTMMNDSLVYMDGQDYVEAYAWFGAFRAHEANAWTGDGVALFDDRGALTDVGALYLGGEDKGFHAGMTGGAAGRGGVGIAGKAWWSAVSTVVAIGFILA